MTQVDAVQHWYTGLAFWGVGGKQVFNVHDQNQKKYIIYVFYY